MNQKQSRPDRKLTGVPETLLIPLWARAVETGRKSPVIRDLDAVKMIRRMDYDFTKFDTAWLSQLGVCVRTMILDRETQAFIDKNPGAVVINLGAGLDTRSRRLRRENMFCWYDLDLPEVIDLRRFFFCEDDQNRFIAASAFDLSWMDQVDISGKPVLIICEGVLMYFEECRVRELFNGICTGLAGSEMLFESLAPIAVGKSRHHDTVGKMDSSAEFKWGLRNGRTLESWNRQIRFMGAWNYADYCRPRWKWFGVIARLPLIGPHFSNRIVHLKFDRV